MGVFDPVPVQTNQVTSQNVTSPEYLNQAQSGIVGQSAQIATQPYYAYQGPRLAGFTPDQLAAQQGTRDQAGAMYGGLGQMGQAYNYGMAGYNPEEVNKYMSPYVGGVVNEIQRLGNQNLMENIIPQVNSTFTGMGQFGSTRNADFLNRAIRDNQYNTLGQQSQALQSAYNQANSQYGDWANRQMGAARQFNQDYGTAMGALNTLGGQEQNQVQQNYGLAYQDFINQRDYPKTQLDWFGKEIAGQKFPQGSETVTSNQNYLPSPFMTGLGALSSVYGLLGGNNKQGGG